MIKQNPFRYIFMDCAHFIYLIMWWYFRPRVVNLQGKTIRPKVKGKAIIAANHTGFADPFVLGATFWRRRMFFLTAKEVMATPTREVLLTKAGCIKIDRSVSDMTAIRNCVAVLKEGKLLGMFPEGHIQTDGTTDQVNSGAILIASQADAPIIPFYGQKPRRWWHRRMVVMGEAFSPAQVAEKRFLSMQDIAQLSALLQTKIEECKQTYESQN